MTKRNHSQHDKQAGFTIVELMIATAVFAVVLLVCASGLLEIGRVYYKGAAISRTQETARLIMDDVADALRFQYGAIDISGLCIGTRKYVLAPSLPKTTTLDRYDNCISLSTHAKLLGERMILQKFSIKKLDNKELYQITVRVATASNDGLEDPNDPNSNCKNERGPSQYCATAELTTVVMRRV